MKKEYDFKKMKWKKAKPIDPKELKIAKTFRIDSDIFIWLHEESDRTGIPYQTLMNAKLREAMAIPDRVKALVQEYVKEYVNEFKEELKLKKTS